MNFFHNIINGLNNTKYIDDNNNINDVEGDFYILPNDEIDTNSEMLSDLVLSKLQLIDEIRSIRKIVNGFYIIFVLIFVFCFSICVLLTLKLCNFSTNYHRTPNILPLEELASLFLRRS